VEAVRVAKRHEPVALACQALGGEPGEDRKRDHCLTGTGVSDGGQGGTDRCSGGRTVVDEERHPPDQHHRHAATEALVHLAGGGGGGVVGRVDVGLAQPRCEAAVGEPLAHRRHGAHRELRVAGHRDLADAEHVERLVEQAGELGGNLDAAACQADHGDVRLPSILWERRGKRRTCLGAVTKHRTIIAQSEGTVKGWTLELALRRPLLYCRPGKQRHPLLTRDRFTPAGSTELDYRTTGAAARPFFRLTRGDRQFGNDRD
jgi:hypothetical protein